MLKNFKFYIWAFILLSFFTLVGCGDNGTSQPSSTTIINLDSYGQTPLTLEQKYSLAYMWNEERLAYDVYTNLYATTGIAQLQNIATRSEIVHVDLVKNLVAWYDINITNTIDYSVNYSQAELDAMPSGSYGIQAIQDLYDALIAHGTGNSVAALEVACMVEVVDVDDLNKYILTAADNQALIDTFNVLRDGSYRHYWAFDADLKSLGVADGCCSLGATYCKNYPR